MEPDEVEPERSEFLYKLDKETMLPIIVGKVFVDEKEDAWVRINGEVLAEAIGVENIDGVSIVNQAQFDLLN